jgi:hypothetical protein
VSAATVGQEITGCSPNLPKKFSEKIQSIYNEKCAANTMQGFVQASENPPA